MTNPSAKLDVEGTVKYNTQLSTNDLMGQKAFIGISSGTGAQKFKIYKNSSTSDGYARFKIDRAFDYGNSEQNDSRSYISKEGIQIKLCV